MNIQDAAKVCYEANRAVCNAQGDFRHNPWEFAEEWQIKSSIHAVEFMLANPDAKPPELHDAWAEQRIADGWTYGEKTDGEKKTSPFLVPFPSLPSGEKIKDYLIVSICQSLKQFIVIPESAEIPVLVPKISIPRAVCTSSAIRSYGYDAPTKTLALEWSDESVYYYPNVPEDEFLTLAHAESKGRAAQILSKKFKGVKMK